MAKLSKAQREALPKEAFGDPEKRLFPVTDQDDLDKAKNLVGHSDDPDAVKKNLKKIAKDKKLKVPAAWKAKDDEEGTSYDDDEGGGDDAEMSALFNLSSDGEEKPVDGYVLRKAPILFRADKYPDKNFEMSPEELKAAVASFSPVEIDLEHKPSVFNNKLGRIVKVSVSPDGVTMSGEAMIPVWLDTVLGKDERKLSAAFHRQTKKLIGCSLVRNPRVSDATLMAAFAMSGLPMDGSVVSTVPGGPAAGSAADPDGTPTPAAKADDTPASSMASWADSVPKTAYDAVPEPDRTPPGIKAMKAIHDVCADNGACDMAAKATYSEDPNLSPEENLPRLALFNARKKASEDFIATFATNPEATKLRVIHGMTSQGGDHCTSYCTSYDAADPHTSIESGPTYPKQRDDEGINDSTRLNQPTPAGDPPVPLTQMQTSQADSGRTASTSEIVQGQVTRGNSPYEGFTAEQRAALERQQAAIQEQQAAFNRLQAQLQTVQAQKVAAEAVNFADNEIGSRRSLPADRDSLIASYTLAAQDDLRAPTPVNFDGHSLTRVEFLKRKHLKLLPHNLTIEQVPTGQTTTVSFNSQQPGGVSGAGMSDDRRKELLNQTPLGRLTMTPTP